MAPRVMNLLASKASNDQTIHNAASCSEFEKVMRAELPRVDVSPDTK